MATRNDVIRAFTALDSVHYRQILDFKREIDYLKNWKINGRPGSWNPEGMLIHHTGSSGNSLRVCINGRPDVPGPLPQVHSDRMGRLTVITAGPANHPGKCSQTVISNLLDGIPPKGDAAKLKIRDTEGFSARSFLIGIEMDHVGTKKEEWGLQLSTGIYFASVTGYELKWDEKQIAGHREITSRKPDPVYTSKFVSMDWFRTQVGINMDKLTGFQTPIPLPKPVIQKPNLVVVPVVKSVPNVSSMKLDSIDAITSDLIAIVKRLDTF